MVNLNIKIEGNLMKKAKANAALLGINLKDYIAALIKKDKLRIQNDKENYYSLPKL